jgi:hypothetical protein
MQTETVLKGVVRAERLPDPTEFIPAILERVKPEHLRRQYGVYDWTDATDFLKKLAARSGKLLRGGEGDLATISVNIINDWQRGRLPYFVPPPDKDGFVPTEEVHVCCCGFDTISLYCVFLLRLVRWMEGKSAVGVIAAADAIEPRGDMHEMVDVRWFARVHQHSLPRTNVHAVLPCAMSACLAFQVSYHVDVVREV